MGAPAASERWGRVLVALQFGLLAVLAVMAAHAGALGAPLPLEAVLALAAGGGLGLWALRANRPGNFHIRPTPHPQGRLVRHGPYRWLRHPMYTAVLLAGAAAARVAGLAAAPAGAGDGAAGWGWAAGLTGLAGPGTLAWLAWLRLACRPDRQGPCRGAGLVRTLCRLCGLPAPQLAFRARRVLRA
jgi:protein-S-isoprenylcysteine O-methyltransferase Ste14